MGWQALGLLSPEEDLDPELDEIDDLTEEVVG
jgi:hypothetical protein